MNVGLGRGNGRGEKSLFPYLFFLLHGDGVLYIMINEIELHNSTKPNKSHGEVRKNEAFPESVHEG